MGSVSQIKITQLSVWNQMQFRDHITMALIFKTLPGTSQREIEGHTAKVLDRVSIQRQDLAGRLILGGPSVSHPSHISLQTSPEYKIPFEVIGTECFPFSPGWTHKKLKSRAFPASCFLDPRLRLPRLEASHPEAPVTAVKLCFLARGSGLVMLVYLHHSYGDGACMAEFLELLGAASRDLAASPACMAPTPHDWEPRLKLELPLSPGLRSQDFASLLSRCPEMQCFSDPPPSLSKPTTGRTFTLSRPRLLSFVSPALEPGARGPSPFYLVAAFLWAWTTQARTIANHPSTSSTTPPTLFNPNNWATKNLFSADPDVAEKISNHFGNTVVSVTTTLPNPDVLFRATRDPHALLKVAAAIAAANDAVDEEFVLARAALFEKVEDAAALAVVLDPRPAWNFAVNTWAFVGKGVELSGMPGVDGGGAPSAMRRVQAAWAGGPHGLVLPGRADRVKKGEVDVVVTLEEGAMAWLRKEEGFRGFVMKVT
ncbi:hypothetical protein QBC39DRAFT_397228 [Podospora conica]|nr:hypothetical protein QBC39DRAFT_397228 [Schizothecium conicum]